MPARAGSGWSGSSPGSTSASRRKPSRAAAEQRQRAVRRHRLHGLRRLEVVGELDALLLLARRARATAAARGPTRTRAAPPRSSASSARTSIRMKRAPSSAAATSATPLLGDDVRPRPRLRDERRDRPGARGRAARARPRARSCAFVRRFCLYGRYRSSRRALVSASADRGLELGRQLALLVDAREDRRHAARRARAGSAAAPRACGAAVSSRPPVASLR